jgi:hypothetical protein
MSFVGRSCSWRSSVRRSRSRWEGTEAAAKPRRAIRSSGHRELDRIERELAELQEQNRTLTARWDAEKKELDAVKA